VIDSGGEFGIAATGRRAVELIGTTTLLPRNLVTQKSIENAMRVLLAISGSTNALVHLVAIARRAGAPFDLHRLNTLSDETPVLVNLKPVGANYMEDFFAAGGVPAVLRELRDLLHHDCPTISGKTIGELIDAPPVEEVDRAIIRPRSDPVDPDGGLVAVFGSLAPRGAIVKRAAADKRLLEHEGRAIVFSSLDDLAERIDSPTLEVGADDILVLQNAGPRSEVAMPEAGRPLYPDRAAWTPRGIGRRDQGCFSFSAARSWAALASASHM